MLFLDSLISPERSSVISNKKAPKLIKRTMAYTAFTKNAVSLMLKKAAQHVYLVLSILHSRCIYANQSHCHIVNCTKP